MILGRRKLMIISGERFVGKSCLCAEIVKAGKKAGLDMAGILSPGTVQDGERKRIDAQDVRSGICKPLAYAKAFTGEGTVTDHWHFDDQALAWGNNVLSAATPCDVLVVDEIGPLEFHMGSGWKAGLAALDSQQYIHAFVVIRPELVGEAIDRWKTAGVITISLRNRDWLAYEWRLRISLLKVLPWI